MYFLIGVVNLFICLKNIKKALRRRNIFACLIAVASGVTGTLSVLQAYKNGEIEIAFGKETEAEEYDEI